MALNKAYIPKEFFSKCKIVRKKDKWVDSELIQTNEIIEFQGAVFNLGKQDIQMLIDRGIDVTLDSKKIYCYIDIDLKDVIEFAGKEYVINANKDYMKHDELRIYYIERVKE